MNVFVVIEDFGLNGADCAGVYTERTNAEIAAANSRRRFGHYSGYGGTEIVELPLDVSCPNPDGCEKGRNPSGISWWDGCACYRNSA